MTATRFPRGRTHGPRPEAARLAGLCAGALLLAAGLAGCGLKGPLTMPEKSSNVVVRGPGTKPAAPPVPATPKPSVPKDDRMPPPPLPGGSTGSLHGG